MSFWPCFLLWRLRLIPRMYNLSVSIDFFADKEAGRENPLIGYAPWANNEKRGKSEQPVYMDLTWAEWEPEEGKFDIKGFEERYRFLGGDGKGSTRSCVLSVTARKTRHIWIFRNGFMKELPTVFSMTWSMGKGYAPDYENREFIDAHEKALTALAEYCNRDTFVAYVSLAA